MGGADSEGRLDGECGDAGGAEERVGGEDHQVGRDSGPGGGIEAGDGEDGLHGRLGRKMLKTVLWKNNYVLVNKTGIWTHLCVSGAKMACFDGVLRDATAHFLYHKMA
jgi:hypothetical protein